MTDIGRWDEWCELAKEHASLDEDTGLMFLDFSMKEVWHTRHPDEVWACYVRPPHESGVKPVGLTPMFVVLMDPRERFTHENTLELHQGTYDEMRGQQMAQAKANIALKHDNS